MVSKAYIVSWLGQGKIVWTPLEQAASGTFKLSSVAEGPYRRALDILAKQNPSLAHLQNILDPVMGKLNTLHSTVNLSVDLAACTVGLQLASLAQAYRILQSVEEVDRKVSLLDCKFELHFLDRSLEYFVQSHQGATGLIPSVSAALEEDCYNALQSVVAHPDIRIPAYLKTKLVAHAQAIESWNQLQYAVIHNGALPQISEERVDKWVKETDITSKSLPSGGYVSQAAILNSWSKALGQKQEDSSWYTKVIRNDNRPLFAKAISKDCFERCYPILLLAREIQASFELSDALEEKLKSSKDHTLLINAA